MACLAAGESEISRWALELRLAAMFEPEASVATCREIARHAAAAGALSVEQTAWLREADALRRAGETAGAATRLRHVLSRLARCVPIDIAMAELWCVSARILVAAGQDQERSDVLRQGLKWLHEQALPHVPTLYRETFLVRSPYVAELISLTDQVNKRD